MVLSQLFPPVVQHTALRGCQAQHPQALWTSSFMLVPFSGAQALSLLDVDVCATFIVIEVPLG